MTGFARTDGQHGALSWSWEVRSVNGRNLDVRCRVPAGFDAVEAKARQLAGERLRRGSLTMNLQVARAAEQLSYRVNRGLLEQLGAIVREAQDAIDARPPSIDGLLALRGVLEIDEAEQDEAERAARNDAVLASLDGALAELTRVRRAEGARLAAVLFELLDGIAELTAAAASAAAARPEALRRRLSEAVAELLAGEPALPEERLAQEVAILVAKADVREELDRLAAHVAAAREVVADAAAGDAVGRRLDFLAQEFNREANTLCAKAQDLELTRLGLDLKVAIDRFREQVQNIE